MNEERMRILEMIEQGTITSQEGADLIRALEELDDESWHQDPEPEAAPPPPREGRPPDPPPDMTRWRNFWYVPLAIGVVVTGFSGLLVFAGNQGGWHWFWMVCAWTPLLLGIFVITAAWLSRTARWLHVRVNTGEDEWPRRIALSFPLPIGLTAFAMKLFGRFIPGMDQVPLEEAMMAIKEGTNPESPVYIEVDEPGGEHVQVYIG